MKLSIWQEYGSKKLNSKVCMKRRTEMSAFLFKKNTAFPKECGNQEKYFF